MLANRSSPDRECLTYLGQGDEAARTFGPMERNATVSIMDDNA